MIARTQLLDETLQAVLEEKRFSEAIAQSHNPSLRTDAPQAARRRA
jgi:hypothetical protein